MASGSLLLAIAVAAFPLFLSATSSDLVRAAIDRPSITRYLAGMTFTFEQLPFRLVRLESGVKTPTPDEVSARFRQLAAGSPILGEPIRSILGDPVAVSVDGRASTQQGRLFAATGVLSQVEKVAGTDGEGVWLPDLIAEDLGVRPGDTIRLQGPGRRSAVVEVDGIYQGIYFTQPEGGFWLTWQDEFRLPCIDCLPPPQPILAESDQVLALSRALGQRSATFTWQAPIADPGDVTLAEARTFERYQQRVLDRITYRTGDLWPHFACCLRWPYPSDAVTTFGSSIGFAVDDAERRIVAVEEPARVLELAGIAVALVVVAAAGAFSVRT